MRQVNLRESRAVVDALLDSLPQSYGRASQVGGRVVGKGCRLSSVFACIQARGMQPGASVLCELLFPLL